MADSLAIPCNNVRKALVLSLDDVQKFINSPSGHALAGFAIAGFIWKLSEKWDAVASETDKIKTWIWIAELEVAKKLAPDPTENVPVALRLFWVVCGKATDNQSLARRRHYVAGFIAALSTALAGLSGQKYGGPQKFLVETIYLGASYVFGLWMLDLDESALKRNTRLRSIWTSMLAVTLAVALGLIALTLWQDVPFTKAIHSTNLWIVVRRLSIVPILAVTAWAWFPLIALLMLRLARRLDVGFRWFNQRFDTEHKPFQSIGFVTGVLFALAYWCVAILRFL